MKIFAVVIFALAIFGARAAPLDDDVDVAQEVEDVIKQILDALSEPLFDVTDRNVTLDLAIETVAGILKELKLSGIKGLTIENNVYDKETSRLDYSYDFEDIDFVFDAELILAGLLNFDHHPIVSLILSNLRLAGYAVIDLESTPHKLTDFSLLVTLEDSEFDASGILNDDDLSAELSEVVTKQLPTIVNEVSEAIAPILNPIVKSVINLIISLTS